MQGLLSGLERKNCWTIAEHLGHSDPEALQHLLSRAKWDDDGVCEDLLAYVLGRMRSSSAPNSSHHRSGSTL